MFGFKSNQRLELSKIIWANKIWRSCIILRWSWVAKVVLGSCMGQVWVKYEWPKCQVSHRVRDIPPGFGKYPTSSLALFLAHFFGSDSKQFFFLIVSHLYLQTWTIIFQCIHSSWAQMWKINFCMEKSKVWQRQGFIVWHVIFIFTRKLLCSLLKFN